ncbi:uncharacterized protein LODBEIA_P06340 [Lodderomyces beijingensis]|uniref:Uncharacterized protein n=1 Tax=Lodderomyces beijingensis TaxID=1775926 RepID=A0ABP0ZGX1_9ASCO
MGSSASKQSGRRLAKTASENVSKAVYKSNPTRFTGNEVPQQQQPSQQPDFDHHHDHQHHHTSTSSPLSSTIPESVTPDESLNQKQTAFRANTSTTFDPRYLHSKIGKSRTAPAAGSPGSAGNVPEGKDGGDPHEQGTSTYDSGFIDSLNKLGRQIESHEFKAATTNPNALPLRQLRSRKRLFEMGESEIKHQMASGSGSEAELQKTMVHPQTLTAILRDLKDPRIEEATIIKDYQLTPTFLKELGSIFRVPTNAVPFEEETKENEVGHKTVPRQRKLIHEQEDEPRDGPESVDSATYSKLKRRLSIDD